MLPWKSKGSFCEEIKKMSVYSLCLLVNIFDTLYTSPPLSSCRHLPNNFKIIISVSKYLNYNSTFFKMVLNI